MESLIPTAFAESTCSATGASISFSNFAWGVFIPLAIIGIIFSTIILVDNHISRKKMRKIPEDYVGEGSNLCKGCSSSGTIKKALKFTHCSECGDEYTTFAQFDEFCETCGDPIWKRISMCPNSVIEIKGHLWERPFTKCSKYAKEYHGNLL